MPTLRTFALALALAGASIAAAAQSTEGEVRKVDKAKATVTLKHGEIKHLGMPAMTMVFRATDPKLLDGVAEGDKVVFNAGKIGEQYVVSAIKKKP